LTKQALDDSLSADPEKLHPMFETILNLVVHKQPGLNTIVLADCSANIASIVGRILGGNSSLMRYRNLVVMTFDEGCLPALTETCKKLRQVPVRTWSATDDTTYNLIVILQASPFPDPTFLLTSLKNIIARDGRLLISDARHSVDEPRISFLILQ
jgi:hypothetical protein